MILFCIIIILAFFQKIQLERSEESSEELRQHENKEIETPLQLDQNVEKLHETVNEGSKSSNEETETPGYVGFRRTSSEYVPLSSRHQPSPFVLENDST